MTTSPILCYCTNVFPAESLAQAREALERCARVRRTLEAPRLALGLYLSNRVSLELANDAAALDSLQAALAANALDCVTLNGFPYGDFHAARVKAAVYRPDWRDAARREYTLRLARLLARLAPVGERSLPISTVALGFGADFAGEADVAAAAHNLARVAGALSRLRDETGRVVVVALEPEPFTALETTEQAVAFFKDALWKAGRETLRAEYGLAPDDAEETLRRHLGLCFDCCHQAVVFEDARAALARLKAEGVAVAKVQLSSALELRDAAGIAHLADFDEPRYLHQTFIRRDGVGAITRARLTDAVAPLATRESESAAECSLVLSSSKELERHLELGAALEALRTRPDFALARSHYHVPVFYDEIGAFGSTQGELLRALWAAREFGVTDCFEIETYTWEALPAPLRSGGLENGIADELRWIGKRMEER